VDSEIKITNKAIRECSTRVLPISSVLVAMYGGAGTIGKNGILTVASSINQAVCAILPNKSLCPKYVFYYVNFYRPFWMADAKGTRKDPNISQETIRNLVILSFDLYEQQIISGFLDEYINKIDIMVDKYKLQIQKLKQAKQSLISEAVTGKIDLRDWQIIEEGE